jgi:MFS family permease
VSASQVSGARLYYATGVLALVGLFNYMDRYGISILVEPIKADLNLTDTEMGLLTGFAFSTTYALFGIPLARMADTRNRIKLLSVCLVVWSAATALHWICHLAATRTNPNLTASRGGGCLNGVSSACNMHA